VSLARLLTRYTEEHPDVIAVREQIAEYKLKINELALKVVTSEVESPNPIYQQLTHEYAIAIAQEEGLQGQLNSLQSVRDEKRREAVEGVGEKEMEYGSLLRRQKVLEQIYATMQARHVEVMIKGAATEGTARIVKNAELPIRPVSPNKLVNLIGGFVMGILLAFLLALGLEYTDIRLRNPEEIVKEFGLKNLGTIGLRTTEDELSVIYDGIISGLSHSERGDRMVCALCFGHPQACLNALTALSGYAALAGPVTLVVLDKDLQIGNEPAAQVGGDLLTGLRDGVIKAEMHPDGYNLLATDAAYPVDLLIGDGFKRFTDALGNLGRAFIAAPVVSHPPAAPIVCAACDGTILIVELRRTSIMILKKQIDEIKESGGNIIGFINLA
jgi:hypothetical protein